MCSVGELGAVTDRFRSERGLGSSKSSECLLASTSDLKLEECGERGEGDSCEWRWCDLGRTVLESSAYDVDVCRRCAEGRLPP